MKAVISYPNWLEALESLTDEEVGKLYRMMLAYAGGDMRPVPENLRAAWGFIKLSIDTNDQRYNEICAKRAEAGRKHKGNQYTQKNGTFVPFVPMFGTNGTNGTIQNQNQNQTQNQNQIQNQNQSPLKGVRVNAHAPAREEVIDFFVKENSTAEIGAAFFDYCDAENWTRKSGQPLLAWQSAARIWMREEYRRQNQSKDQKNGKSGKSTEIARAEDFDNDI